MIEKILAILNSIPSDKVAHCLGGVVLFAIGQLFGYGLFLAVLGAITKRFMTTCTKILTRLMYGMQ